MIFKDVATLSSSGFNPDVCIIGSGPAGITLALQLEKRGVSSVIVEAGGFDYDADMQNDVYQAKVIGDPYFDLRTARLRYFGGTSGHWAGWCRPLEEVDFEPRRNFPNSGWPIRRKDLEPYALAANNTLEVPLIRPDEPLNENWKKVYFRYSPPVRFGRKYRNHIQVSPAIALLLNHTVVDIVPVNGAISRISTLSPEGKRSVLKAKLFCLCTGGIENSRMLLWANRLNNGGVVPYADTLGKYWMEHPIYGAGEAVLLHTYAARTSAAEEGIQHYAATANFIRRHGIGNVDFRMFTGGAFKALVKQGLCIAPEFFSDVAKKARDSLACGAVLRIIWEQSPVSSNRIELDKDTDINGMPRARLYWQKQPLDRRTMEVAVQNFGGYFARANQGRIRVIDWITGGLNYPADDEKAGFHHLGGTRMANAPAEGVVDGNCKVFGVDNLYVGGSSVFPTGGYANPTYSIVQLALRLGDHLADKLALERSIIHTGNPQRAQAAL